MKRVSCPRWPGRHRNARPHPTASMEQGPARGPFRIWPGETPGLFHAATPHGVKTSAARRGKGADMAENEQGAQPTEPTATEPHGTEPTEPEKDWKAEYEKVLAQSRKWEQRSKDNAAKAKELDELKAATQTDAEKLADATKRAEEAEAKIAEYERAAERAEAIREVAAERGIDADILARMAGDTREEIEGNAEFIATKLSGAPIYPSVTDNGQKKAPSKKSAQDQFGDWFATVSNR